MEWGLLGISITFLIVAYIVVQGTRAASAWRRAADAGDIKVIRDIAEDALSVWRSAKRPREVPAGVWRGVQSMELVEVAPGFIRVSCQAEGEYKLLDGRWVETANALQVGKAMTARAVDMLLYELPHFRPARVQVDVYLSFREEDEQPLRRCILSTAATREAARAVDWEEWTPEEIVAELGGRYRLGERGQPLAIEVEEPAPVVENGSTGSPARTPT